MKTAISIDDVLLREADKAAREMGLSRSRLVSLAVEDFVRRRHEEETLRRLNEVYSGELQPPEKRLLKGIRAKFRKTVKDRW